MCVWQKKLLVNLIRRRRSSHSVLQLSSYSDFKQDMLEFVERLYCVPEPFLTQVRLLVLTDSLSNSIPDSV